jgi:hypothetical protein
MTPDQINAFLIFVGSLMVFKSCFIVYRDKSVRGVSIIANMYFTAWGMWNVFYFPHLHQYWSFGAEMCICTANILWISLMLYYKRKEKSQIHESDGTHEKAIDRQGIVGPY